MISPTPLTPLFFGRHGEWLYERLSAAQLARHGLAYSVDGSAAGWEAALQKLPPGLIPQIVLGAPLESPRSFEAASGADLCEFSQTRLRDHWLSLQAVCGLEVPAGTSIVVLQSTAGLALTPENAFARASLLALRAMIKAAVLESRGSDSPRRFNLLLAPPVDPPVAELLDALAQIAAGSFMTGSEVIIRGTS